MWRWGKGRSRRGNRWDFLDHSNHSEPFPSRGSVPELNLGLSGSDKPEERAPSSGEPKKSSRSILSPPEPPEVTETPSPPPPAAAKTHRKKKSKPTPCKAEIVQEWENVLPLSSYYYSFFDLFSLFFDFFFSLGVFPLCRGLERPASLGSRSKA